MNDHYETYASFIGHDVAAVESTANALVELLELYESKEFSHDDFIHEATAIIEHLEFESDEETIEGSDSVKEACIEFRLITEEIE